MQLRLKPKGKLLLFNLQGNSPYVINVYCIQPQPPDHARMLCYVKHQINSHSHANCLATPYLHPYIIGWLHAVPPPCYHLKKLSMITVDQSESFAATAMKQRWTLIGD